MKVGKDVSLCHWSVIAPLLFWLLFVVVGLPLIIWRATDGLTKSPTPAFRQGGQPCPCKECGK